MSEQSAGLYLAVANLARTDNRDTAIYAAKKALQIARLRQDKRTTAIAALTVSNLLHKNSILQKEYFAIAMPIAMDLRDDSLIGSTYLLSGTHNFRIAKYDAAMEDILASITYFNRLKTIVPLTNSKVVLAQIYQEKNQLASAIRTLKEVIAEKKLTVKQKLSSMHTLANVYGM